MLWTACLVVAGLAALGAALWARHTYVAVTVNGLSMSPTFKTGDRVLVRRGLRGVGRGRIVVVARPDPEAGWGRTARAVDDVSAARWYIKRVVALGGDPVPPSVPGDDVVPPGHLVLVGDSPVSVDSKRYGPCPTHQVLGVFVRRLPR